MSQSFNPFEHHHDHYHDDDDAASEALDPAQRSASDALRVCFLILKFAMLLVIIYYVFSGIFSVKADHRAVIYRFGKPVSEGNERIKEPGGLHFAWPYPIDLVEHVPISEQVMDLPGSFWPAAIEGHEAMTEAETGMDKGPLNPENDGSLITGDANIVHAQFSVSYQITDVEKYIENRPRSTGEHRTKETGIPQSVKSFIQSAAEQGMIFAVAQVKADEFINQSNTVVGLARSRAQKALDASKLGITIKSLTIKTVDYPRSVKHSVTKVTTARQDMETALDKARGEGKRILQQTAGDAHELLNQLITDFELAIDAGNLEEAKQLQDQIDEAFSLLEIKNKEGKSIKITGMVSTIMSNAQKYARDIVSTTKRDKDNFEKLLPEYRANPRVFRERESQKLLDKIMSNPLVEKKLIHGKLYLELRGTSEELRANTAKKQKPTGP